MKKIYIFLFLTLRFVFASAQQVGMYSHAFFKPMVYNPAFTGNDPGPNAMLVSRAQWTDFNGAPQLNLFCLDGDLVTKKVGLGICLLSDRKGITNRIGGTLNYSYRLNFNDVTYLRFGLAAGVVDQTLDFSKALVEDGSDPTLFAGTERKTFFDANAGLAFFWKGLELGFAVPQIIGNKVTYVDNTNVRAKYTQVRHFLGTLKYSFPLSKEKGIYIAPQALVRFVGNTPLQYDGTLNFEWRDKFWIGATYKSDYAVAAHAGVCIHKQLYIGYAYDIILGDLSKYSGVSHEVMVNFRFGKNKKEDKSEAEKEATTTNKAYEQRMDSLQSVVEADQDRIRSNDQKIKELSDKLEQLSKAQQAAANTNNTNSATNNSANTSPGQNNNTNNNTNSSNPISTNSPERSNENQNAKALATSTEKTMNNGIWFVTNSAGDYKDANDRMPKKGFYVIAGTFVYRDFAQTEAKRLSNSGFKSSNWMFSEPKQYNYVFVNKVATKEEAIKKAEQARSAGIKDAWVLQLTE
jgi:type IX secretion system PorP/SprF family membrane protein